MEKDKSELIKTNLKKEDSKKSYTKPELTVHGDLDTITKTGGYSMPPEAYMGYPP